MFLLTVYNSFSGTSAVCVSLLNGFDPISGTLTRAFAIVNDCVPPARTKFPFVLPSAAVAV